MTLTRRVLLVVLFLAAAASAAPIRIRVDATGAPSNVLHSHLSIPVNGGPITLYYPKWIPGEHSPSGPLIGLAGLKFTANGAPLARERAPAEIYAIRVDVPANATTLDVDLDYLAPAGGALF